MFIKSHVKFPEIVDQPGLDVFGQVYNQWKNKECVCPNCSRSIAASRFAPHLEKCLGMGRNSSRIANRRYESIADNYSAFSYNYPTWVFFIFKLLFAESNAESLPCSSLFYRIVTGNNTNNKSESDQEDNDDVNDNDWSYGAEKKGEELYCFLPVFGSGMIWLLILSWNLTCIKILKCFLILKLYVCFFGFFYSQEKEIW